MLRPLVDRLFGSREPTSARKAEFSAEATKRLVDLGVKIYQVTGEESVNWLLAHGCQIERLDCYFPKFMERVPEITEVGVWPERFFLPNSDGYEKDFRKQESMVEPYLRESNIDALRKGDIPHAPVLLAAIYRHFEATGKSVFKGKDSATVRTGSKGGEIQCGTNLGLVIGSYYAPQGQLGLSLSLHQLDSWSDRLFAPVLFLPPRY